MTGAVLPAEKIVGEQKGETRMRQLTTRIITWAVILLPLNTYAVAKEIPVVVGADASDAEKFAAEELTTHLQHLYPDERFSVATSAPGGATHILLGTVKSQPKLAKYLPAAGLAKPESFLVCTAKEGDAEIGVIAGADPRGVLYGVYGLLEKLGYGFYLSYNTEPPPRPGPFQSDGLEGVRRAAVPRPGRLPLAQLLERLLRLGPAGVATLADPDRADALQHGDGPLLRQQPHFHLRLPREDQAGGLFHFHGQGPRVGHPTRQRRPPPVRRREFYGPRVRQQDFDGPGRKAHRGRHRSDAASLQVGAQPRVPCLLRVGRGDPRIEPAGTDSPTAAPVPAWGAASANWPTPTRPRATSITGPRFRPCCGCIPRSTA